LIIVLLRNHIGFFFSVRVIKADVTTRGAAAPLRPCSVAFSIAPRRVRVSRTGRAPPNGLSRYIACTAKNESLCHSWHEPSWHAITLAAPNVRDRMREAVTNDKKCFSCPRESLPILIDRDFCSKFIDETNEQTNEWSNRTWRFAKRLINPVGTHVANIEKHAVALLPRIYIWVDRGETRRILIDRRSLDWLALKAWGAFLIERSRRART